MWFELEPGAAGTLYEQIGDAVRSAIVAGRVGVGEQLPPARAMADALGVNMHTVLRAYSALEDEGLIRLRRRHGATVLGSDPKVPIQALIERLVTLGDRYGLSREHLARMIREAP